VNPCLTQMQPNHEPSTLPNSGLSPCLYRRGVEHDTNRSTKRLGGKGSAELGTDDTRVAVRAGDLAPNDADLGAADLLLALVDVGYSLAEVEVGGVGVVNTLNLDQTGLGVGDVPATLVAEVATLDV